MDPYLHYHRTLALFNDNKLAWMCFAMDLPPAKRPIHDFLWHGGKIPPTSPAVVIHVLQDVLWHLTVRRYIGDRQNVWKHRVAEILWTRKHHELPPPDINAIKEGLRPFGGWGKETEDELNKLMLIYRAPKTVLASIAGISVQELDSLMHEIDERVGDYLEVEKALLLLK